MEQSIFEVMILPDKTVERFPVERSYHVSARSPLRASWLAMGRFQKQVTPRGSDAVEAIHVTRLPNAIFD